MKKRLAVTKTTFALTTVRLTTEMGTEKEKKTVLYKYVGTCF